MSKQFDPATVEALSRAVCEAWGLDPDKERPLNRSGLLVPTWQTDMVHDTVTAYLAMRAVGATMPMREEPNRG